MQAPAAVDELDAVRPARDEPAALGERLLEERLVVVAAHPVGVAAAADQAHRPAPGVAPLDPESRHPASVGPCARSGRERSGRTCAKGRKCLHM
jgi:hypothetical protein